MRFVDLSSPIDAGGWEPEPVSHTVLSPADGAKHMSAEMREHFGIEFDPAVLPYGELLSIDTLTLTSHTGTHVDAPAHYGTVTEYGPPPTIDQLPLEWFYGPGVVLDLSGLPPGSAGGPAELRAALARAGHTLQAGDIVLLHTGASRLVGTPAYFSDFVGLDGHAVDLLLDAGVRVVGTDAFSLDAPFTAMLRNYQSCGDPAVLWPAHFAGRRRPYCQIERLANLDALPSPTGFIVTCFPVKIAGGGAGWTRAVALVND
ncbi:MAG TPA: cyclase family protein [Streptosporangiaceae bacterium]|nr:cyclase family protein [Streptosporangiaceae bacterium]